MNIPSTLLAILNKHNGTMMAEDGQIQVSPVIIPTVELCLPHIEIPPSALVIPNQSFITATTLYKNASGGATQAPIVTLSAGVWRLRITLTAGFNYTDTTGVFASLTLGSVFFTLSMNLLLVPIVAGAFSIDADRILCLPQTRVLYLEVPGNAATQIGSYAVSMTGDRIV